MCCVIVRRHRVPIGAAIVVAMTLITMTVTSALLATRVRCAEANAVQEVQAQGELCARMPSSVSPEIYSAASDRRSRGRDTELLREILDHSIAKAGMNLSGQPAVELAVRNLIASALYDMGDARAALRQPPLFTTPPPIPAARSS